MASYENREDRNPGSATRTGTALLPFIRARSNDIEDQAAILQGWDQHYLQYEAGKFEAVAQTVAFPRSSVFRKSTNRRLQKRFAPPKGSAAFGVLMGGSAPTLFQGRPVGPGDLILMPGGSELELLCRGSFDIIVAIVHDYEELARTQGVRFSLDKPGVVKDVRAVRLGRWLSNMVGELGPGGHDEFLPAAPDNLEREVILRCLEVSGIRKPDTGARYAGRRAVQVFGAVRAFIIEQLNNFDTVPDLARIAVGVGVSHRTLEYAFKDVLGVSPQRYLMCWRLHRARKDLRELGAAVSVAQVAMKWGFSHLGRFAIAYKEMFGEAPSLTLKSQSIANHRV